MLSDNRHHHDHDPRDEDLQEIEGQIEADKKLQEKLILEDFGPSTAGRVRFHHNHDGDGDGDGDGYGDGEVLNDLNGFSYSESEFQIRKSLWSITEYPETSMLARVNAPNHHKAHHDKYHWTKYKEHSHHQLISCCLSDYDDHLIRFMPSLLCSLCSSLPQSLFSPRYQVPLS